MHFSAKSCNFFTNVGEYLERLNPDEAKNPVVWHELASSFPDSHRQNMKKYWLERNTYNLQIEDTVTSTIHELRELFAQTPSVIHVTLMSSYGAQTNLCASSDIDIGVIVKDMNIDHSQVQIITDMLTQNGYTFSKFMNGYYCYSKYVKDVEIEVKVRDLDASLRVIRLHEYLDNECDTEQKMIYTYLKYKLNSMRAIYPKAYSFIKMLFYNVALLQIDPACTWFITNI